MFLQALIIILNADFFYPDLLYSNDKLSTSFFSYELAFID